MDDAGDIKTIGTDPCGGDPITADQVKGAAVYNPQGERLGHVEDVVLHKVSGRVAFALMAFGGFLGVGERFHPLPWTLLAFDTEKNGYVVPLDKEHLKTAPTVEAAQFNAPGAGWGQGVLSYYNVTPFWM